MKFQSFRLETPLADSEVLRNISGCRTSQTDFRVKIQQNGQIRLQTVCSKRIQHIKPINVHAPPVALISDGAVNETVA